MKYFPRVAFIIPPRLLVQAKDLPSLPQFLGSHFTLDKWSVELASRFILPLHLTSPEFPCLLALLRGPLLVTWLQLVFMFFLYPLPSHHLPSPSEHAHGHPTWQFVWPPPASYKHSPYLVGESYKTDLSF